MKPTWLEIGGVVFVVVGLFLLAGCADVLIDMVYGVVK